jgi:tetratricopeptide (TPR) repeat protein
MTMARREDRLLGQVRRSRRLLAASAGGGGDEAEGARARLGPARGGEVHAVRALRQEERGRLRQAVGEWERSLELEPEEPAFYLGLASALGRLRRFAEASRWLNRAIALRPECTDLREALYEAYQEQGLYTEAEKEAETLVRLEPRSSYGLDLLAFAYYQQGKWPEAIRVLGRLIRLEPAEPYHHFKLALLLQHKGEVSRAMREYQRALELEPGRELSQIVQEAIFALDTLQIQQLVMRAAEDRLFRHKLARDAAATVGEYGYHLSEMALEGVRAVDWDSYGEASGSPDELIH